jgi:hypothetical protein
MPCRPASVGVIAVRVADSTLTVANKGTIGVRPL